MRHVKQGTRAVLLQSGLDTAWWSEAMSCFCYVHNLLDAGPENKTAFRRRFGEEFSGPHFAFGCSIRYKPSSPKVQNQMHPFGSQTLPGIFMGYHLKPGGVWSADIFVVDCEELSAIDKPSEVTVRHVHSRK